MAERDPLVGAVALRHVAGPEVHCLDARIVDQVADVAGERGAVDVPGRAGDALDTAGQVLHKGRVDGDLSGLEAVVGHRDLHAHLRAVRPGRQDALSHLLHLTLDGLAWHEAAVHEQLHRVRHGVGGDAALDHCRGTGARAQQVVVTLLDVTAVTLEGLQHPEQSPRGVDAEVTAAGVYGPPLQANPQRQQAARGGGDAQLRRLGHDPEVAGVPGLQQ